MTVSMIVHANTKVLTTRLNTRGGNSVVLDNLIIDTKITILYAGRYKR